MKLRELKLKNFGKFHDKSIQLQDGINVICGENESGKTTMHTFIKAMLFGLERGRGRASAKDTFSRYEPWEYGNYYSGELKFQSNEKDFCLQRNFDKYSKSVKLYCETDGEELSPEDGDLEMVLDGLTASSYENTLCIGQLHAATNQALAAELKNYATGYYMTGDSDIDVSAARAELLEKKKEADREAREMLQRKERKREALEQEAAHIWRDIHYMDSELKEVELELQYRDVDEVEEEPAEEGWVRGIGVNCCSYHVSNVVDMSEVAIELNPDNSVTVVNSWEEMGQGGDIGSLVLNHEALRELNLKPEQIHLNQSDSKISPPTGPAAGSRSHYMAGNATIDACNKLVEAMRKDDGTFRTYDEMVAENIDTRYVGTYSIVGRNTPLSPNDGSGDPTVDINMCAQVATVEVQPSTGKVRVLGVHSCADVGVIGNYLAVDGQAYGGMEHSIGFALSEDYDEGDKKCATMIGCGFPECEMIPDDMVFEYIQTPRDDGPFGSGGCSELFQSGEHVTILNAIADATGVRMTELPATADKIKAAIEAKEKGEEYRIPEYFLGVDFEECLDDILDNPVEVPVQEAPAGDEPIRVH